MGTTSSSPYFTYALLLVLVGSIFSGVFTLQPSFASHTDITAEIDGDFVVDPNDTVVVKGNVEDGTEDDQIEWSVDAPSSGDNADDTVDLDDDGDFDFTYDVDDGADDGLYTIEIKFEGEESVFLYFIVDDDTDLVDMETDRDTYSLGDDVRIEGTVDGDILDSDVDVVEITIFDPNGEDILRNEEVDVDDDGDFEYDDFQIDDGDDAHGMYGLVVSYDDNDEGFLVFEVEEDDGGSSSNDPITIVLSKTSYKPGDNVGISGEIDEPDPQVEAFVTVEDPSGDEVYSDHDDPSSSGAYNFDFDLDDDAPTGTYTVNVEYNGDDLDKTFQVSTSTSSGGSGTGSGTTSGLTAKLSKTSILAGETITVSGVVPRIVNDEPVNIVVLAPDGKFVGVSSFPDPESDKSYSATLRLPSTLEEEEDYSVVVSYDNKDVKVHFDITGTATGSTGGAISVKTDKTSYTAGSTVTISGDIADDTFAPGLQIALQVLNPEKAPYRFDPVAPDDDGSYSYSLVIGGPLGITGKYQVKVNYNGQAAETSFDLTGGVPSKPTYNLKVADKTYPIEYQADGSIKSMFIRAEDKKLVVSIDATQDGTLTLVLPREVIDAVEAGSDIKYVVATEDIDTGSEGTIDVREGTSTGEYRTLVIDYDEGTDLIEIQGTNVVPEFGTLSAIVLAIAILSIVALTAKFSNRFSNNVGFGRW